MTKTQAAKILSKNIKLIRLDPEPIITFVKFTVAHRDALKVFTSKTYHDGLRIRNNAAVRLLKELTLYVDVPLSKELREKLYSLFEAPPTLRCGKYSVNEKYFTKPTIENCYYAGFIAADGNIRDQKNRPTKALVIHINSKDREILERLKEAMRYTGPVTDWKKDSSSTLKVTNNQLCEDLEENFNITPRKTHTLKPPNLFDPDFIKAYIIGLIDGDGSIGRTKNGGYAIRICGTKDLLNWVRGFIGIKTVHPSRDENIWSLSYSGSSAKEVAKLLSSVKAVQRLGRKWDKTA